MSNPSLRKIARTSDVSAPSARRVTMSRRLSTISIANAPTTENDAMTSTSSEMKKIPHFS